MYLKRMIHLIESLNYVVMYYTDLCTHWLLYAYVFKRKRHTLDCFNKSEAFSLSLFLSSVFHTFYFHLSQDSVTKTVECGLGSYVKAKNMTF